jgi:hypothetical protein
LVYGEPLTVHAWHRRGTNFQRLSFGVCVSKVVEGE